VLKKEYVKIRTSQSKAGASAWAGMQLAFPCSINKDEVSTKVPFQMNANLVIQVEDAKTHIITCNTKEPFKKRGCL